MNIGIDNKSTYIAFKVGSCVFAIPANNSLGIIKGTQNMPYTIIPNASENMKYILESHGQLIIIVQMPGIYEDIPITDSFIVVLERPEKNVGIFADEVHLITIPADEITVDKITGQIVFIHNEITHFVVDICQLCKELGI